MYTGDGAGDRLGRGGGLHETRGGRRVDDARRGRGNNEGGGCSAAAFGGYDSSAKSIAGDAIIPRRGATGLQGKMVGSPTERTEGYTTDVRKT